MINQTTAYLRKIRGISIIEVSFFVVVFGAILTAGIPLYDMSQRNKKTDTTTSNVTLVRNALNNFYLKNGYLPCPAARNIGADAAGFGRSRTCNATGGAVPGDGTVSVPGRPAGGNASSVRIGSVPVRELGLPDNAILDGNNHRLVYAISESYGVPATPVGDTVHGVITVNDRNDNPITAVPGIAVFVVATANADGSGAWTLAGRLKAACPAGSGAENCNDDDVFISDSVNNTIAFKADTCTPQQKKAVGNIGDITFLLDTSNSMTQKDITQSDGTKTTRMSAAKNSLTKVVPAIADYKSQNDPDNLLGFGTFETFCEGKTGTALTNCKKAAGSCYGLSGTAASSCLYKGFDSSLVEDRMNGAGSTVSSSDYSDAATSIVDTINNLSSTTGGTPLYDNIIRMADSMQDGKPEKNNVLVVVSDGEDTNSMASNTAMIDYVTSKYPNLQVHFVYVGTGPDKVKKKVFAKTPSGNTLKGKFIAVQDSDAITEALLSATSPCPQ